jgi:hypothetical protein
MNHKFFTDGRIKIKSKHKQYKKDKIKQQERESTKKNQVGTIREEIETGGDVRPIRGPHGANGW